MAVCLSKKARGLFRQRDGPPLPAGFVRLRRTKPTHAPGEVFFPTHMSPKKTNLILFAPQGANSVRPFRQTYRHISTRYGGKSFCPQYLASHNGQGDGGCQMAAVIGEICFFPLYGCANRPLHGTKLLVSMAMSRSRGESMMRHPTTPAALQPKPMHILDLFPCAKLAYETGCLT